MVIRIPIKAAVLLSAVIVIGAWLLAGSNNFQPSPSTNQTFVKSGSQSSQGNVVEFNVTAKQFSFEPNPIRVKLGDMVRLKITSKDVVHGFSLPEFGISEILEPGKTKTIEFQAVRKGTFQFLCSVSCGSGHSGMRGALIVE